MRDVQFMSAKEKEMVLKQWTTFIKKGLKWEHFTDRLYKHLTLHCSFIAHFNRGGFYETYFHRPEDTVKFLRQFDKEYGYTSAEYGWNAWIKDPNYSDLNEAMCKVLEPCKASLYEKCQGLEKQRDITAAVSLLAKHGIGIKQDKLNEICHS